MESKSRRKTKANQEKATRIEACRAVIQMASPFHSFRRTIKGELHNKRADSPNGAMSLGTG